MAFAAATSSFTHLNRPAGAIITLVKLPSATTPLRSRDVSYGRFLWVCGVMAMDDKHHITAPVDKPADPPPPPRNPHRALASGQVIGTKGAGATSLNRSGKYTP